MSKRKRITPEQAASLAQGIVDSVGDDPEGCHVRLDGLLCEVLIGLGYTKLVRIFEKQEKWYG